MFEKMCPLWVDHASPRRHELLQEHLKARYEISPYKFLVNKTPAVIKQHKLLPLFLATHNNSGQHPIAEDTLYFGYADRQIKTELN